MSDDCNHQWIGNTCARCGVAWEPRAVEEVPKLEAELERMKREAAALRGAIHELQGVACEFIGPDEDGKPECNCCGMSLETVSKGHKHDCLANLLLGLPSTYSSPTGSDYVSKAEVRPIAEALQVARKTGGWSSFRRRDVLDPVDAALATARKLGLLEDKR